MAVSMADMERVVLGGGDDIGNVIELGDLNDDLGMSLLMNPSKVTVDTVKEDVGRTVSFSAPSSGPSRAPESMSFGGDSLGGIEIAPLEPLEPIRLSSSDGPTVDVNSYGSSAPPISFARENASSGMYSNSQTATGPGIQFTSNAIDPVAEKKEKSDYLNKLQRLEQKGFPVARKFTMDNSLEEIKTEFYRLVDARNLEASIKFQRQMLMGAITGLEWLNGKFDPFDVHLEGWSESVHENVEDFDEIFEELYDKYKDKGKMSPEMRLVMAVVGSGFMCHVSNTFFRSKMPSMDDLLRRNPDLAKQMAAAAAGAAGPGFGNFMGAAMGMNPPPAPPMFSGNGGPMGPMSDAGAFMGSSGAVPVSPPTPAQSAPTARREMKGPTGVDDILKTFEEVRRAEAAEMKLAQPATGFASQPAVAAAVSGAASVMSAEEYMSTATGVTGTSGRRRRKQTAPPTGATFSLNV